MRAASDSAGAAVMGALNRNAVKLALPALFEAMADPKWQTKEAATKFLGHLAAAFPEAISVRCSGRVHVCPRGPPDSVGHWSADLQPHSRYATKSACCRGLRPLTHLPLHPRHHPTCPLQVYLPEIVPVVTNCMVDLKPTVRTAATEALTKCCAAIGNRDIEPFVPHLIRCIGAPSEVPDCVHKLSATTFVQSVDARTLSILAPLLVRGLTDRTTPIRRKACVIIRNMAKVRRGGQAGFRPAARAALAAAAVRCGQAFVRGSSSKQ